MKTIKLVPALVKATTVLLLLLFAAISYGKKDENTLVVNAGWFKPASGSVLDTLRATSYLPAIIDTHGVFVADYPKVRTANTTISLHINPYAVYSYSFDVTLEGYYKRTSPTGPGLRDSTGFKLQVNYNPATGSTYKQRDAVTVTSSVYTLVVAKVTVNGISIADTADQRFTVELHTEADEVYTPVLSETPVFNTTREDATAENILWDWPPVKWAEYYELEYVHVDDYKADGTRRERGSLSFNFREDGVRLRMYADEYEMPLVFEQGYVVARIRAVGFKGTGLNIPVYSNWSLNEAGTVPAGGSSVFEITPVRAHEADRLNWQYVSTFNESGMRSESVAYADATNRVRQQVAASPEDNKLLVSETLYDNQGRPAVTVLPVPTKPTASRLTNAPSYNIGGTAGISPGTITLPAGTANQLLGGAAGLGGINFSNTLQTGFNTIHGISPSILNNLQNHINGFDIPQFIDLFAYTSESARLGYVPKFNVTAEGNNIQRNDFDTDRACDSSAMVLGTQSGAARYYSSENPEQARWQAYVPDAEGYPYTQLKYRNDGTGNAGEASLPGPVSRTGGGKTRRYFYGTPSQYELDRFFGTDAGAASFYKKTLMLDENGQAHVSIYNIKGKQILSALTGVKPANLEAVTGAEQTNVTVDLIDENNILNATENAWVSTKRMILPAASSVEISYRTTSPNYAGRYCTGTNFCYDCVYDLEISITNDCGNVVYRFDSTVGRFHNFNACESFTVNPATTLTLPMGSYLIAKKLKVSAAAVNAYVNNYIENFTCRADTLRYMADVDASCNARCLPCQLQSTSAVVIRRDGSNPSFYFNYRKTGNNSACVLACPANGYSDLTVLYQNMLNDVSPGGQYAEYRDTLSRTADNPLGTINPIAFPLSVLNNDNQLPLRNGNWRNPIFNYQTKTGETAYIAISDDGFPSHRSPASEIITRFGRQYVLPKYLNDVADFIRLWEPQWAEALVVYHPEYEYLQWSAANRSSYTFDSLMVQTEKYSDAVTRNLTDFRNDPLFPASASVMRTDMEARLNSVTTVSGTPISAAQLSIISVHCGNPNFSAAQFTDCYTTKTLFATPGAQDKEWMIYKGLYRKTKMRVLASQRNRIITSLGGFNNRTIGGTRDVPASSLYAGKTRVFKEEDDVLDELGLDFTGEEPTIAELEELRYRKQRQYYADCGVCPTGTDLITLFNSLNYDGKLTASSVTLPGISPLTLTKNIVNSFSNSTALQYNWARVPDANPNMLRFRITTGGVEMGTVQLQKSRTYISWDSILMFDCFQPTGEYTFTMRAVTVNDSTDIIQGRSSCFKMNGCTFPRTCNALPAEGDMLTFLQYLFEGGKYKRTYFTVHTNTAHSPHFGVSLANQHPAGRQWQWNFGGYTDAANTAFNARFNVYEGSTALSASPTACDFTFRIVTPGFTFDSVGFIVSIRKPNTLPAGRYVNEAEVLVRSKGGRLFYIALGNSCYRLFDCPADVQNATRMPGMCCSPPPRKGVINNTCESSLRLIARRETERDFYARRDRAADSLRAAYIHHCLQSVAEVFTVRYSDGLYMATLYYYDQSENLVKTVPPKGVRVLTGAQIDSCRRYRNGETGIRQIPAHKLATTYTYTTYGAVAEKTSPDEGTTKYSYDFAGRNIASRNAVQQTNSHATYTLYDAANRILETGRTNFSGTWQTFRRYSDYASSLTGKADVTITTYDEPSPFFAANFPAGQKRLRNRVAVIKYQTTYGTDAYVMAYSYDALGKAKRVVQYYPVLGLSSREAATAITDYTFDKLSGKVICMVHQPGRPDQFIHWFSYDAAKRLTMVQTATSVYIPERLRETEAKYYYYQHGPLARVELGSNKIQGIDYAYTIQGWLKGVNSYTTGNGDLDMGRDGTADGGLTGGQFGKDVMAELLNYHEGDYKKIGTEGVPFYPESPVGVLNTGFSKPLYNGNVQSSIVSILQSFSGDARKTFAQAYSYDQGNRLRQAKNLFGNVAGFDAAFSDQYAMVLDYDLNGNITTLSRTGNSSTAFDNLTYNYTSPDNNNRLNYIADAGAHTTADLRNQSNNNYTYDELGRLIADASEGISSVQYNTQNKVSAVSKSSGNITYTYDAFGKRISKKAGSTTTWYVNDLMGRPLAIYSISGGQVKWVESSIYGAQRVGLYKPDMALAARDMIRDTLQRGLRNYQLHNHTGDVMAVVTDRKVNTADGAGAEMVAASNYYPYGMEMPGRSFGNEEYRYGFHGMESEDDIRGTNNNYTTEFRQYDPRTARWLSVDPKGDEFAHISPYAAFADNPVMATDAKGDTADFLNSGTLYNTWRYIINHPREAFGEILDFISPHTEITETRAAQVSEFSEDAQRAVRGARVGIAVVSGLPGVSASDAAHLVEFNDFLGEFSEHLEDLSSVADYVDVTARLVDLRNDINSLPRAGDERLRTVEGRREVAETWGRIMHNLGEIGGVVLPEFMSGYTDLLSEMEHFFSDVLTGLDPAARPRERRMGMRDTGVIVDPDTGRRADDATVVTTGSGSRPRTTTTRRRR